MVSNSTSINKTDYLSPQIIENKNNPLHMELEILILDSDRHKNMVGLN
jgi:hypothetical protein